MPYLLNDEEASELIRGLRAHDRRAVEQLYSLFAPRLLAYVRGMVNDVLGDPRTRARGWVRAEVIDATRRGDPTVCGRDAAHHQWTLMCLELWARTYVDRPREELGTPLAPLGASLCASEAATA